MFNDRQGITPHSQSSNTARVPALDSVVVSAERPLCTDPNLMKAALKEGNIDFAFEIALARYQELHAVSYLRPEKILRQADLLRMMSATGRWIEARLDVTRDAESILSAPDCKLNGYSRYLMASLLEFRLSGNSQSRSEIFSAETLFQRLRAVQRADAHVEPFFQHRQSTLLKAACAFRQTESVPVNELSETVAYALDAHQQKAPRNAFMLAGLYHYIGRDFELAERYAGLAKRCPEQQPSDPFAVAELEARSVYHRDPERAEGLFLQLLKSSKQLPVPWEGEERARVFLAMIYDLRESSALVSPLLEGVRQPQFGEAGFLLKKLKTSTLGW